MQVQNIFPSCSVHHIYIQSVFSWVPFLGTNCGGHWLKASSQIRKCNCQHLRGQVEYQRSNRKLGVLSYHRIKGVFFLMPLNTEHYVSNVLYQTFDNIGPVKWKPFLLCRKFYKLNLISCDHGNELSHVFSWWWQFLFLPILKCISSHHSFKRHCVHDNSKIVVWIDFL